MGFIQELIKRKNARKEKMKEAEENEFVFRNLEQRKLSHDERNMVKILEEERKEYIKEALRCDARKRTALDKLKSRDMMKFNPEFFSEDVVLNQKNIFLRGDGFI